VPSPFEPVPGAAQPKPNVRKTLDTTEHINHPERVAWESMCATDEGRERGEKWCKRAIWGNTLPNIRRIWKSVNKLTSGAFVAMWQQRVEQFYLRYSEAKKDN
jgi:hypothetical protein